MNDITLASPYFKKSERTFVISKEKKTTLEGVMKKISNTKLNMYIVLSPQLAK